MLQMRALQLKVTEAAAAVAGRFVSRAATEEELVAPLPTSVEMDGATRSTRASMALAA
jgi:hypothetical protein